MNIFGNYIFQNLKLYFIISLIIRCYHHGDQNGKERRHCGQNVAILKFLKFMFEKLDKRANIILRYAALLCVNTVIAVSNVANVLPQYDARLQL